MEISDEIEVFINKSNDKITIENFISTEHEKISIYKSIAENLHLSFLIKGRKRYKKVVTESMEDSREI